MISLPNLFIIGWNCGICKIVSVKNVDLIQSSKLSISKLFWKSFSFKHFLKHHLPETQYSECSTLSILLSQVECKIQNHTITRNFSFESTEFHANINYSIVANLKKSSSVVEVNCRPPLVRDRVFRAFAFRPEKLPLVDRSDPLKPFHRLTHGPWTLKTIETNIRHV